MSSHHTMGFNRRREQLMQHKKSIFMEILLDKDSAHFVFIGPGHSLTWQCLVEKCP